MTTARATVALVGLGNIGFRHLQGLKSLASQIRLIGIDLSADNLARARAEWTGDDALFTTGADVAGESADVLILATSSQGRLKLLRQWGDRLRPRQVILEKITFTDMADFDAAAGWAARAGAAVWVNCPRRVWPSFQRIRAELAADSGPIALELTDPDFGLACNGVHLIDALQFLSGEAEVAATVCEISEIVDSKRAGYKEVHGRMVFATPSGHSLGLTVQPGQDPDRRLHISRGAYRLALDQAKGLATLPDGQTVDYGRAPYQSELSGRVVADLLATGSCGLATLEDSARAHSAEIEPLRALFEVAQIDCSAGLPIT